jgi:hypothetical protein
MMNDKPKFRHELKYIISELEREVIAGHLRQFMESDANADNGVYFIRSLYFDDMWETAYGEKEAGTSTRKKYRIRTYNHSDTLIRLECKQKEGQYINKISAKLNREETEKLINGDTGFLLNRSEQVCHDFYIENVINRMKPKVIVDYDREPYIFAHGDVRITFDSHVRAGIFSKDIFDDKIPVMEVLEPHQLIMEVKFTEYLPEIIRDLLQAENSIYCAASKYVMCLEKQKELLV